MGVSKISVFCIELEDPVMDESLGGLKRVKIHVRLQPLCCGDIVGSNAFEHEPRVGLGGGAAAREQ